MRKRIGKSAICYGRIQTNLEDWNDKVIETRTENLGSVIWAKLAVEWLGFEKMLTISVMG